MEVIGPEVKVQRPVYQLDELQRVCDYTKPKRPSKCANRLARVASTRRHFEILITIDYSFSQSHGN